MRASPFEKARDCLDAKTRGVDAVSLVADLLLLVEDFTASSSGKELGQVVQAYYTRCISFCR